MAEDPDIDEPDPRATSIEAIVANHHAQGLRLDRFLQNLAPDLSRSRLQRLIRLGHVTLNDRPGKPSAVLKATDRIKLVIPTLAEPQAAPEEIPLSILHEDADIIVIDKPAGMVVHPGAGNPDGTVVNALLHHCQDLSGIGDPLRPGIVHRLDKDTSGCLVAAKNDDAHRALALAFAERAVRKFYLAVVTGQPRDSHGILRNRIGRHPIDRQRMTVLRDGTGKEAVTEWHSLQPTASGTLLLCRIFTGRTHQIRVHLGEDLGCPVLGDPVYGTTRRRKPIAGRLMLHAWRLEFPHPTTREPTLFEAAIPPEFAPWTDQTAVQSALDSLTARARE